ncbi:MAG: c-type cytochrome [Casimicrobiaceae bacterium]
MKFRPGAIALLAAAAGLQPLAAIAADTANGASLFATFCASCHGPAANNQDNVLLGANNATAIQIQMQRPGSAMGYLQDLLDSADLADIAAYLGTVPGGGAGNGKIAIVEYYHAGFDHYFMTGIAVEIAGLDSGTIAGWKRTGQQFTAHAAATSGSTPVCRFFSASFAPKSSHFYTPSNTECLTVKANPSWTFEAEVFQVALPPASGACSGATRPLYRLYNDGQGGAPNHRYTIDLAIRTQMIGLGWIAEGYGPLGVSMCVL